MSRFSELFKASHYLIPEVLNEIVLSKEFATKTFEIENDPERLAKLHILFLKEYPLHPPLHKGRQVTLKDLGVYGNGLFSLDYNDLTFPSPYVSLDTHSKLYHELVEAIRVNYKSKMFKAGLLYKKYSTYYIAARSRYIDRAKKAERYVCEESGLIQLKSISNSAGVGMSAEQYAQNARKIEEINMQCVMAHNAILQDFEERYREVFYAKIRRAMSPAMDKCDNYVHYLADFMVRSIDLV